MTTSDVLCRTEVTRGTDAIEGDMRSPPSGGAADVIITRHCKFSTHAQTILGAPDGRRAAIIDGSMSVRSML